MGGYADMHRFLIAPESIKEDIVYISGEDLKHMLQVLRLKTGNHFLAFDGTGMEYEIELISIEKGCAKGKLIKAYNPGTEPKTEVILFQGLPKSDKMEWVIQKTVELGISKIVPIITQFSVRQKTDRNISGKLQRWNRISKEACKQSGRVLIPEVTSPVEFSKALGMWRDIILDGPKGLAVFCYENEGKKCLKDLFNCYNINDIKTVGIFIGAEGGFSEEEIQLAKQEDITPVGLGKRILRTETAAVAALSIIMHEMGELA